MEPKPDKDDKDKLHFETSGTEKDVICAICKRRLRLTFFREHPNPNDAGICPHCQGTEFYWA